jgi:hypothetical protein
MNAIQQISLKLQMGIDPSTNISPKMLRSMWLEASAEKFGGARETASNAGNPPLHHGNLRTR